MKCYSCEKKIKTKRMYKVTEVDHVTTTYYFCSTLCMEDYFGWNKFIVERVHTNEVRTV